MSEPPIKPNREWSGPDNLVAKAPPPRINRARAAFRIFLWILPTGFALLSIWIGFGWIAHALLSRFSFGAWGLVNLIFALGVGWCHALLPRRGPRVRFEIIGDTLIFVFLQFFLVPILLGLVLFLTCTIAPNKIGF
ncbi:MAG: hypothetical protein V4689_08845 [Verrucomicrobiota bacterium]